MKRGFTFIIFIINIISFSSLINNVCSSLSIFESLKIIVPSTVIFSTCLGASLTVLDKWKHRGDRGTEQGDDSVVPSEEPPIDPE